MQGNFRQFCVCGELWDASRHLCEYDSNRLKMAKLLLDKARTASVRGISQNYFLYG